jgi:hypothetical protein
MRTYWRLRTTWEHISGTNFNGINIKTQRRSSNLEIMFYDFSREKIHT